MKRKGMNAMAKFLVPLTIFLSASLGDAFVNHARLNHLIRFQQPMRDSTNEPSCEPICEPTNNRMEIDKVKSNKREPIASHSSIKRDKSTPTFQLVVASVSNKREPIASHSSIKYLRTLTKDGVSPSRWWSGGSSLRGIGSRQSTVMFQLWFLTVTRSIQIYQK